MGGLAERWTGEMLHKSPHTWEVVPSFKLAHGDVDHVAICPGGIVALETKWTSHAPADAQLRKWAHDAAAAARTLRLQITSGAHRGEVDGSLFRTVLVVWEAGPRTVAHQTLETPLGPVAVMNAHDLDDWLAGVGTGRIGQDYAERLRDDLDTVARERDRTTITASRTVRYLARTR